MAEIFVVASMLVLLPPAAGHAQEAAWKEAALNEAATFHRAQPPTTCDVLTERPGPIVSHELQIDEESAARQALLVQLPCRQDADHQSFVYLLADERGAVSEVLFPSPVIDVRYVDNNEQGAVDAITIIETLDRREVINAQYDTDGRTMVEHDDGHGVSDVSSTTTWGFRDGRFQIMHFAVDASYDGEVNPLTLIDEELW